MSTELKIKVCGMRDPANLEELCTLAPDFVGFIFYPGSKRFVGSKPEPALFRIPDPGILKVGVFVNEEIASVRKAIKAYALDGVQLHGGESVEYCQSLKGEALVIKVLAPDASASELEEYKGAADHFLFDTPGAGKGGTGRKFDWRKLKEISLPAPFLLSGGIAPGDAGTLRNIEHTDLMGIDLNSRFELSPGLKNVKALKEFFLEIRK